jgi:hypothetical protein
MSGHAECPCPNCPSPSDCEGAAETQRLRDALERIARWDYSEGADNNALSIARAALAGTPSKDTA